MKRIRKIVLSAVLCCTLTNANASLWDKDSIFNNVTDMSIATDPMSGATYVHGGGIEVRFKRTGNYPPIFSFGSPGFKASCRGISFDAGYAMFMNLERLGQQLSQAGASLAYGVLIGLVYTLPGVEQAFSKLNEWSSWLQNFLNDSCSIGQNFGRSLGGTMWSDLEDLKNEINNGIPSPEEYLSEHPQTKDFIKKVYNSGTELQKNKANTDIVGHSLKDVRGGLISTYLNSLILRGEETISFPVNKVASIQTLDSLGFTQSTKMMAYYLSALMDSIAVDEKGFSNAVNSVDSKNQDSISKFIEEIGNDKSLKSILARNNVSVDSLINLMLSGEKGASKFKTIRVATVNLDHGSGVKEQFVVLTNSTSGDASTIFDNFEGYIGESKRLVYYVYNQMVKTVLDKTVSNPINSTELKVPSVYPNMSETLRNLVLYYGKKNTYSIDSVEDPEITDVLNYIAYSNAIRLTSIAIDNINQVVKNGATETSDITNPNSITNPLPVSNTSYKETVNNVKQQREKFEQKIKEMKEVLFKKSDEVERDAKIRDINEVIKKAIRDRNLRGNN